MTKVQAVNKLKTTKQLSTEMLRPLGITFEHFLRLAQLPKEKAEIIIDKMIEHFEK